MENIKLKFWGVRGSYAAPFATHLGVGGNTSCVEIRVGEHLLICDAGTGIIPLGNELMLQKEIQKMFVLLTHYHWDHVCGLPFFVPAFAPNWTIDLFGPGNDQKSLKEHISMQMQAPYFPVGTEAWMAKINYLEPKAEGVLHDYGPIQVSFSNVHHPGLTYGYRIKIHGKTIVYISDNECKFIEKSIKYHSDEFSEDEHVLFDEMIKEEHQTELALFQNADILIHDAQYTQKDYKTKRGWGHSCYIDVIHMAIEADVKELYLFHHDPNHDDDAIETIYQHALEIIKENKSSLNCYVAKEGITIDI